MQPNAQAEATDRINKFLKVIKRTKESALIFTGNNYKGRVFRGIKDAFPNVKTYIISSEMTDKEEIDKVFMASMREGALLIVSVGKSSPSSVIRRLEQIFEDGHIPINVSGNWRKVEPTDTWQAIIWVNRDEIREDEFPLGLLISHKLVVE